MYPIVSVCGREVGSYALLAFTGFLVCGAVVCRAGRRYGLAIEDVALLFLVIAAGLLVGGHGLYALTRLPEFLSLLSAANTLSWAQIWQGISSLVGGMVFYGGFLGGLAALAIYRKRSAVPAKAYLFDLYAMVVPLFHTFGRVGCFLAGCCYGVPSAVGFTVVENPLMPEVCGVRRFPVALAEAACNFGIFLGLYWLFKRRKARGYLLWGYLLLYPPMRFVWEFHRGDDVRGIWFGLSTSQWISLVLFLIAVLRLTWLRHIRRRSQSA